MASIGDAADSVGGLCNVKKFGIFTISAPGKVLIQNVISPFLVQKFDFYFFRALRVPATRMDPSSIAVAPGLKTGSTTCCSSTTTGLPY
jgi:hypothetical protein